MNLVSPVADLTCDIKKEVKQAALECMTAICNCTGNKDRERLGVGDGVLARASGKSKQGKAIVTGMYL